MPLLSGRGQHRSTPNGKNKWTHDQRLTLHLLHTRLELNIDQRTKIFNTIFADPLCQCGLPDGLHKTRITAQYAERLKTSGTPNWRDICAAPTTSAETAKRDLIAEQITRVGKTLQIVVRAAAPTASAPHQNEPLTAPPKRGRPQVAVPVEDELNAMHLTVPDEEYLHTPTPKRVKRAASQMSKWTFDPARSTDAPNTADISKDDDSSRSPKRSKSSRKSPEVVVPATPKRRSRPRQDGELTHTHWYPRPKGGVWTTPEKYEIAMKDLVAPIDAEAHPPLAGVLFRYWTDDCQSKLNGNGEFVARKFSDFPLPVPTVARPQWPEWWWDIGAHMNRNKVQSPFISTCNDLTWVLRLAVGELKSKISSGRITVIDASAIDRRSLFHAQPFHRELCKKMIFDDGAWHYSGKREFLVYGKIKSAAVMHTFKVNEIMQLSGSVPAVDALLRLNQLATKGKGFAATIQPELRAQNLALNAKAISAVAKVVLFLGLKLSSRAEHVMHVVSDLLQGWGVAVTYQSSEQWLQDADIYVSAMSGSGFASSKDLQKMKLAFLEGVRWSRGVDTSTRHKTESMRIMLLRAKKIGLDDPAKILCDELDATKLNVKLFDKKQQKLLQGNANQVLLQGPEEDDETMPMTPRSIGLSSDDDIVYDSDD